MDLPPFSCSARMISRCFCAWSWTDEKQSAKNAITIIEMYFMVLHSKSVPRNKKETTNLLLDTLSLVSISED